MAALGVVSAVLGVVFALGQHDLKRLLAYHSVENIGIILIGLGFAMIASAHGHPAWGRLALAGGLLHVWNHGLFKALLFFGAGSVLHATGTREMSRLGGLWRAMPWTAGLFGLGAMAIAGLPPLNGFVSEWLVFLGLFDALPAHDALAGAAVPAHGVAAWAAAPAAVLLGLTGALALACFVKVCGVVFLGLPRSEAALRAHECGWRMRVPMLVLGALCVAIGFGAGLVLAGDCQRLRGLATRLAGSRAARAFDYAGLLRSGPRRSGDAGGGHPLASRPTQRTGAGWNLGLRLRRAHGAHAIHGRLIRRHHHRLVRVDSAAAPAFARAPRQFSGPGQLRGTHARNRAGRRR